MLTAVQMSLRHLSKGVDSDNEMINKRLNRSRALTERTVSDLRSIIAALRPTVLDQLGLIAALEWICEHTFPQMDIQYAIELVGMDERLPEEIETILFRIAQETINNISRHSNANHVNLEIHCTKTNVKMQIQDNGRGFDVANLSVDPENGHGLGLAGMRERAALAGGQIDISSSIGQGTAVSVIIPLTNLTEKGETHANQTN
jgi:signal transduction histidine kinase